jgi:hypothetical protein
MSSMNKQISNDTPILTVGQVNKRLAERDEKVRKRDQLTREIEDDDRWLAAASLLAGGGEIAALTEAAIDADAFNDAIIDDVENMADATKRILSGSRRALSHSQLQEALRKTPLFADRLDKNPNYYYTMVSRLVKRGEIEKFRKLLRMPKTEPAGT